MLLEFNAGRRVTYRVNPQRGGHLETVAEVYAPDFFKEQDGVDGPYPTSLAAPAPGSLTTGGAPALRLRRRGQAALQRIFLPDGYPNSVTDDLLAFALWDLAQALANNIMATLSVRAVLLGVGVGESGANITSSTLSWIMRDGMWMIGSIVFASLISQDLEYRAKTWRLVADFTNDMASLLELCAPWLPGGQLTFRAVVVIASVIKALVGVCGGGTRASFTQHFALRGNAADVSAKASTRANIGSLVGLALGMAVAYVVPAESTLWNLSVFSLCTVFHVLANYRGVRGVQLKHLNAPRLEWCLAEYCVFSEEALVASKKGSEPPRRLDLSPRRANAEERLFVLPALRAMPPPGGDLVDASYRLLRRYVFPATLLVRMHCGASLSHVLQQQNDLTARRRQELVQHVEGSLATRGIALLVDDTTMSYYLILPEYHTATGVPESWVRYRRQHEASLQHSRKRERRRSSASAARAGAAASAGSVVAEAAEAAAAEAERIRQERVLVPAHILPLGYRQLWAYFYAYMHCRAMQHRREALLTHANGVLEDAHKNRSLECQRVHLITRLRADGLLDEDGGNGADAVVTPEQFEEMTSPTSTTAARLAVFPRTTAAAVAPMDTTTAAAADAAAAGDGLYPQFVEFVRALRRTGWELDRLLITDEGCTTMVHYL